MILLALGMIGPARGQGWPQPRLRSLSRLGVRAGESVDVIARGTDLEGVHTLWFDHPGLRAFHLKGQTFRVACATGVPTGPHDVRAVGPFGVSNPRTFVVGDRPESVEVEPNNSPAQASPIALNSVVNGEISPQTDVDCFAFEGKRGERVFLDLAAERAESRLDATLRVVGPGGAEVAESRDTFGADPFLDLALPADGRYVVKVHDVTFGGSPENGYRLTLHDGPHLDAIVPAVAEPGISRTFTLLGRNLGGEAVPGLMVEGRPLERRPVTLTPTVGDPDPLDPSRGLVPAPAGARRGFEYRWEGKSNPVFVAEAVAPVVVEAEPNDEARPQAVAPPCDISGSFGAPGDLDIYRFQARKGEVWRIEAEAERIGSTADPAFVVQKVVPNGPSQDLASAEDTPDHGAGARFHTASADPSLRWVAPEDGTYQIAINDLFSSQRGDARLTYRLAIRPERPDFRLFAIPDDAANLGAVTVGAGGRASATLFAWRLDGFAGPIRVEARDLPQGVRCDPVVIRAGQNLATIVFEAAEGAKPVVGPARLVGRGRWGDRKESLRYIPGAATLGPEIEREAIGGGMIWPPANPQQPPTLAPARLTRGFVVAVGAPSPIAMTVGPADWVVAQGHFLRLDLALTRREGAVEPVNAISPHDPTLPQLGNFNGTPNGDVTIAKGVNSARSLLFVGRDFPPGTYMLHFQASGPVPFSKDPNAKTRPNVPYTTPANPITLTVRPAPVSLTVNENKGATVKAGGTVEVPVTIARRNGFAGAVTLSLGPSNPTRLSAEPVTLGPAETKAKLVVKAPAEVPAAVPSTADVVRAVAVVVGEPIEVEERLSLTVSK